MGDVAKRLVENLSIDLRTLSTETKKKHPQVKDAAETALVKVRNIADVCAKNGDAAGLQRLRAINNEILHPLLMGMATHQSKCVQLCLHSVQQLVMANCVDLNTASTIVNELWHLTEAECEELKVLQTVALLVTTSGLVNGAILARCLVICFRLHFARDPTVINTASASVRQLVNQVFDRVNLEDQHAGIVDVVAEPWTPPSKETGVRTNMKSPPTSLRPSAADAFMLFQDICILINGESPQWLTGIRDMTRTLGLELMENVLAQYSHVFGRHGELLFLVKEHVCPLVIKLFSPNLKFVQVSSQHPSSRYSAPGSESPPERPYFPIAMRLLRVVSVLLTQYNQVLITESEIFLSLILKFLDGDKLHWQRALALEVLHRITTNAPLLQAYCSNYDARKTSTRLVEKTMMSLASMTQTSFVKEIIHLSADERGVAPGASPPTDGLSSGPGFIHRQVYLPLAFMNTVGAPKALLLELVDKHEAPALASGYCLSLAHANLIDTVHSLNKCVQLAFEQLPEGETQLEEKHIARQLFESTQCGLLSGFSLLLDASTDETISCELLKCLCVLLECACRLESNDVRDACIHVLCKASLPDGYMARVLSVQENSPAKKNDDASAPTISQVVATSIACPCKNAGVNPTPAMLTAKNVQCVRVVIETAKTNGGSLGESWRTVHMTLQHVAWMLGINWSATHGEAKWGESSTESQTVLTTAVMADMPVLVHALQQLTMATIDLNDGQLKAVLRSLYTLSAESLALSQPQRAVSFYGLSQLLCVTLANVHRMTVWWDELECHLVEACGHQSPKMREWACIALCRLVVDVVGNDTIKGVDITQRQSTAVRALWRIRAVPFEDIRQRQVACLTHILQTHAQHLHIDLWTLAVDVLGAVVDAGDPDHAQNGDAMAPTFTASLIKEAYTTLSLIVTDFITLLPVDCVRQLVQVDAKYGGQQVDLNISLSAVDKLWTMSDYLYANRKKDLALDIERIWLVLYACLSDLCVDTRPSLRKSACQTLLQTISSHGHTMSSTGWQSFVWTVLYPLVDRVATLTAAATTHKIGDAAKDSTSAEAVEQTMLIHHSRDSQYKQWTETHTNTTSALVKIVCAQKIALVKLEWLHVEMRAFSDCASVLDHTVDDFGRVWAQLLRYMQTSATNDNDEISLAALKSFAELANVYTMADKNGTTLLTTPLSTLMWQTWLSIATYLCTLSKTEPVAQVTPNKTVSSSTTTAAAITTEPTPTSYTPASSPCERQPTTPSHLATLLSSMPCVYDRCVASIANEQLNDVFDILHGAAMMPMRETVGCASPYITTQSEVSPVHDAVIVCVKKVFADVTATSSAHRAVLPQVFATLQRFIMFAAIAPISPFAAHPPPKTAEHLIVNSYVSFGELCCRLTVEFYSTTAVYAEVTNNAVLADIVRTFTRVLAMKYELPAESTWKTVAWALQTCLHRGLPIARQNPTAHSRLWPAVSSALRQFIFHTTQLKAARSPEQRLLDEQVDCQLLEMLRDDVLPYANHLPTQFVNDILALLNDASLCAQTYSSTDSDSNTSDLETDTPYSPVSRPQLASLAFECLLAMSSQTNPPDLITGGDATQAPTAVVTLLSRCEKVLVEYVRDEQLAGTIGLSTARVNEMCHVLTAIASIIDTVVKTPTSVPPRVWTQLISLYTICCKCLGCRDVAVRQTLQTTVLAYRPMLRPAE